MLQKEVHLWNLGETRWNSMYDLATKFLETEEPIRSILRRNKDELLNVCRTNAQKEKGTKLSKQLLENSFWEDQ